MLSFFLEALNVFYQRTTYNVFYNDHIILKFAQGFYKDHIILKLKHDLSANMIISDIVKNGDLVALFNFNFHGFLYRLLKNAQKMNKISFNYHYLISKLHFRIREATKFD